MPELSSQEPGARKSALAKVARTAGKVSEAKGKAREKFVDTFVPGTGGEVNPFEEVLGPKKDKPSLEKQAIQRQAAAKKSAPKKRPIRPAAAAPPAPAQAARQLRADKARARRAKAGGEKGGLAGTVGGMAGQAASAVLSKAIIRYALVVCGIWAVLSFAIIGIPFYLLYLALLYMIMLGLPNMGKNIILGIIKIIPFRIFMPGPLKKAYDAGMAGAKNLSLRMGALDMFAVMLLTVPLVLFMLIFLFMVLVVSALQGLADTIFGPLQDLVRPLQQLFDSFQ